MAASVERRAFPRYKGHGIFVQMNAEMARMIDISVAGIRVQRPLNWTGVRNVRFQLLHSTDDGAVRTIPVSGHVVGVEENQLRIAFSTMPQDLKRMIDVFQNECDHETLDAKLPVAGLGCECVTDGGLDLCAS